MIKVVDKERWITISQHAELLKLCTAMAAEIAGASVLTRLLTFCWTKFQLGKFNECINKILEDTVSRDN